MQSPTHAVIRNDKENSTGFTLTALHSGIPYSPHFILEPATVDFQRMDQLALIGFRIV